MIAYKKYRQVQLLKNGIGFIGTTWTNMLVHLTDAEARYISAGWKQYFKEHDSSKL